MARSPDQPMTDEPMEFTPGHEAELIVKRSSRSRKTGPGSRGGRMHDPAYKAGYNAGWRKAHPEYVATEKARLVERRRRIALARDREQVGRLVDPARWFAAWLAARLSEQDMSQRTLALQAGVDHSAVSRLLSGHREPGLAMLVALVDALGYDLRLSPHNQRRTRAGDPADNLVAGPRPFEAAS